MSLLTRHREDNASLLGQFSEPAQIARELDTIGVLFERWQANQPLAPGAPQEQVLAAYREPVDRLMQHYGFQSADVIGVTSDHPDKQALRAKFLSEHTHDDFEARFFVEGRGLFYLHVGEEVYCVLCEAGDLISVPANVTHWFDMGENPHLQCIRLFTTPEGWVAKFTGSDIGQSFPTLDRYQQDYA